MILSCDMHSHILPNMDDGAKSIDESVLLLNSLKDQGVNNICLTPHFYTHKESCDNFLRRRQECFELLKPFVPEGMTVTLGAEVFLTDFFFHNEFNPNLCYSGTKFLLVELNYDCTFTDGDGFDYLEKLLERYGVIPVIAHIERYRNLFKNNGLLYELKQMGVMYQINAVSFNDRSLCRRLIKLMKNGYIDFIGTDAHSFTRNSPENYSIAYDIFSKKVKEVDIFEIEKISLDVVKESIKF